MCSHMDREEEVFRTVRNVVSRALESVKALTDTSEYRSRSSVDAFFAFRFAAYFGGTLKTGDGGGGGGIAHSASGHTALVRFY